LSEVLFLVVGYVVCPFLANCASVLFLDWLRGRRK
jgi:hypothetical protein